MAMNMANVATTAERPTILMRTPLTRPTSAAAPIASEKPRTRSAVLCPSPMKNDRITTTSPVSGPTDRSMPPVKQHDELADADEGERARQEQRAVDAALAEELSD